MAVIGRRYLARTATSYFGFYTITFHKTLKKLTLKFARSTTSVDWNLRFLRFQFSSQRTSALASNTMSQSPQGGIPDEEENTEPPLTMAASVILTNLTRDASKALEEAGDSLVQKKGEVCYFRQSPSIAIYHHMLHSAVAQTLSNIQTLLRLSCLKIYPSRSTLLLLRD
jgi:hypothetical protein